MITALDFLRKHELGLYNEESIAKIMIEFTRIHCVIQAKVISENVKTFDIYNESTGDVECKTTLVNKDSILNAYSLDNVK